jgi:hypothetical protein
MGISRGFQNRGEFQSPLSTHPNPRLDRQTTIHANNRKTIDPMTSSFSVLEG